MRSARRQARLEEHRGCGDSPAPSANAPTHSAAVAGAQSVAEAHSATASAVGGTQRLRQFTSTVRKCADAQRGSGGSAKRGGGTQRDGKRGRRNTEAAAIHQHHPQMRRRTHLRTPRGADVRVGTSKHTDSYIRTNNRRVKKELQIFAILVAGSMENI